MLVRFFTDLRAGGVPVTLPEFLSLLEGLEARLAALSPEDFYYLARMALVKDERHFDRFDRVFAEHFAGAEKLFEKLTAELPAEWLKALTERLFSEEEKRRVARSRRLGQAARDPAGNACRNRQGRHEGGSKWIGTAGTSPFGNQGFNPEGVRIGQAGSRQGRALKVWEARDYRNLDDGVELGTRNLKMALRRLRRFAREGAPEELDLEGTIDSTARNAGILDIRLQPERRNAIKLLLLLDVGGSMDPHVKVCEELFSAARAEFKHLEYFYFHNFPYERLWKDNARRFNVITDTQKRAAHLQFRLPRGVRRRCDHESLRNRAARRQRRTLERRAGPRLDATNCVAFSAPGVAQSRARRPLEMDAVHSDHARDHRQPHVPADARRNRSRHA